MTNSIFLQRRRYERPERPIQRARVRHRRTSSLSIFFIIPSILTVHIQALRHSKVKLTWDDDDPERNHLTRRTLTKTEIEENDFRAYIASSESESESETEFKSSSKRNKLRALLLGGGDDALPEGWGQGRERDGGDGAGDMEMEITFTPGLSQAKNEDDETTLEAYRRKMKEKKKKRKEERLEERVETQVKGKGKESAVTGDNFFANDSGEESASEADGESGDNKMSRGSKKNGKKGLKPSPEPASSRHISTAEELSLIAAPDNPDVDPNHFDMKAVMKAEKAKGGKKRKMKKGGPAEQAENETQDNFAIDLKDNRFKALHENHTFAIDPSNPQ